MWETPDPPKLRETGFVSNDVVMPEELLACSETLPANP